MGEPPEDEAGHLLDRWKQDDRDDEAWYRFLRAPMRRAAWRGIQRMIGHRPNEDDVGEVLYEAFVEFFRRDPADVTSLVGLATSIAYRRGQDRGRALNHGREFPDAGAVTDERNPSVRRQEATLQARLPQPGEALLEAEGAEEQEHLRVLALECLETLPPGQMEVVRATIMRQQNISDWANENGKSYQAADQQRNRGLNALKRCVEAKQRQGGGDHVV